MKVVVDLDACIGCGLCEQVAPDVYEMDGDKAIVKVDGIPEEKAEETKDAADQCPVNAIAIS